MSRVTRRFEKEMPIFSKNSQKVAKSKKGQNIKFNLKAQKHLQQTTFETLKYLQQTMF